MTGSCSEKRHIAIIMDGNGRWATERGLPRTAGHRRGADSVRSVIEEAPSLGIGVLTLYAFSSDNWKRPESEVNALMDLFRTYLKKEKRRCIKEGVRVKVIGRRDRLPADLLQTIRDTESATAHCRVMDLRLAVDYSARDLLLRAMEFLTTGDTPDRSCLESALARAMHDPCGAPEVDLLIRTGGEQRLSDFLLWECAYAEFLFVDKRWPDFGKDDLKLAIQEFARRQRKYGTVSPVEPSLLQRIRSGLNPVRQRKAIPTS
jgi:undecaprenyl diphosphate synthase